ncbi:MAG: hypothetical protein IT210_13235 [Armatimonadetes bacterium]|nr:hypothetical protein [Armatimonadota bacterium]
MRAVIFAAAMLFLAMAIYASGFEQQSRSVRLEMRILRFDCEKDGIANIEIKAGPVVMTMDNIAVATSMGTDISREGIEMVPHINRDGSFKLTGKIVRVEKGKTRAVPFSRIIPKGQGRIVAGSTLPAVQKEIARGRILRQPAKHTAVYRHVTPSAEQGVGE